MTEQRIDLGLTSSPAAGGGCGDGCRCGHGAAASTPVVPSDAESTTVLRVEGMTCEHCVRAVTEELDALEGVTVVGVDLRVGEASLVRITGAADDDALSAAVDEAGYTRVG